jgi:hypothetical protein
MRTRLAWAPWTRRCSPPLPLTSTVRVCEDWVERPSCLGNAACSYNHSLARSALQVSPSVWSHHAGDTDVDLFVASSAGRVNRLFINNGTGFFVDQGAARGVSANNASSIIRSPAVGDFDGDGGCP